MKKKSQAASNKNIAEKAKKLLEFAEERAAKAKDWGELFNALYAPGGKANELFPSEAERRAFTKTKENKRLHALINKLPSPPIREVIHARETVTADAINGGIILHLPSSVRAALVAEAAAEGVTLQELCLSKLVAQLRSVVERPKAAS